MKWLAIACVVVVEGNTLRNTMVNVFRTPGVQHLLINASGVVDWPSDMDRQSRANLAASARGVCGVYDVNMVLKERSLASTGSDRHPVGLRHPTVTAELPPTLLAPTDIPSDERQSTTDSLKMSLAAFLQDVHADRPLSRPQDQQGARRAWEQTCAGDRMRPHETPRGVGDALDIGLVFSDGGLSTLLREDGDGWTVDQRWMQQTSFGTAGVPAWFKADFKLDRSTGTLVATHIETALGDVWPESDGWAKASQIVLFGAFARITVREHLAVSHFVASLHAGAAIRDNRTPRPLFVAMLPHLHGSLAFHMAQTPLLLRPNGLIHEAFSEHEYAAFEDYDRVLASLRREDLSPPRAPYPSVTNTALREAYDTCALYAGHLAAFGGHGFAQRAFAQLPVAPNLTLAEALTIVIYQGTFAHYAVSNMVIPYGAYVEFWTYDGLIGVMSTSLPTLSGTRPLLRDYATEVGADAETAALMRGFQRNLTLLENKWEQDWGKGHPDVPWPSKLGAGTLY